MTHPTEAPTTFPLTTSVSFSSLAKFMTCPRAYQLRYEQSLSRISTSDAIYFGSGFHDAVELYYRAIQGWQNLGSTRTCSLDRLRAIAKKSIQISIQDADPDWRQDPNKVERWNNLTVTIGHYLARWGKVGVAHELSDPKLEIVDIERAFDLPLINPDTGRPSRTFRLVGKLDGVVRLRSTGKLYVLERKTTGNLEHLLEKMFTDFQTRLYFDAVEQIYDERPAGVIYDITERCGLRQGRRRIETAPEFEERMDKKVAKFDAEVANLKTEKGKVSGRAKRDEVLRANQEAGPKVWEAETDESYRERVQIWLTAQSVGCYRSIATFTDDDIREVKRTVWQVAGMIREARRAGVWPQNWTACFSRFTCGYVPICQAGGLDEINGELYEEKAPHSETADESGRLRDIAERAAVMLDVEEEEKGGEVPF